MTCWRLSQNVSCAALLIVLMINIASAQVPDYDLLKTQTEKDSLATAEYPYIFPLFGKNVVRKGFDLPLPVGISVGYYQQSMGVIIDQVSLGLGAAELMPLTFVGFEDVTDKTNNFNAQLDLWLFPFLDIYGIFGHTASNANVTLNAPFEFETAIDFSGWTYGGGAIFAFGVQGFWITANGNLAWTDMEEYYDPVRAAVLSFRLGRTFKLLQNRKFEIWLGTTYLNPESTVNGYFLLTDIVTDELAAQFQDYYLSDWYNALTPEEQQVVDAFVQTMMQAEPDTRLDYEAEQHPEDTWNMLAGAQLELNRRWNIQAEAGFLSSRTSVLVNLNYRLPL